MGLWLGGCGLITYGGFLGKIYENSEGISRVKLKRRNKLGLCCILSRICRVLEFQGSGFRRCEDCQ